ncbi:iron ABC transporter permease [Desulfovibrionales bacterium]
MWLKSGAYRASSRTRLILLAWGLVVLLIFSVYAALFVGPFSLPAADIHSTLARLFSGQPISTAMIVVRDLRLARIVLAVLAGACLAVSGTVFQGLLRNPLADPFTLGISSGAACGATLALTCAPAYAWIQGHLLLLTPVAALVGAFVAMVLVLALSRMHGSLSRESLVLGGIVVSTFLGALISLVKALHEESVSTIVFWIMGSFQGRGWEHSFFMLPLMGLGLGCVLLFSRELDILRLGKEQATLLGVAVTRARVGLLLGAGMLTAAAVSVSGIIGFVGLVVPHLLRVLVGADTRPLLLLSGLGGAFILLWSDVLARTILSHGAELPVGVVTALFGGPFFCLVLARTRNMT